MSILDTLLGRKTPNTSYKAPQGLQSLPLIESVTYGHGYFTSDQKTGGLDEYKGWTYACVRSIAEKVGTMELSLNKHTGGKMEIITDHPVLTLLADINPFMTMIDVFVATQSYLELEGNAFWFVSRGTKGFPTSIFPLRPDLVTVIPDPVTFVKEYIYQIGNEKFHVPVENIIHFKEFDPKNALRGLGTAYAAATTINGDNNARQWMASFFRNGARIDGYLMKDGDMTSEEHRELTQKWSDKFRGVDKAHKTPVLSGGLKYVPIGTTSKDMDFVNLRTMGRDEILAFFRVPKTVLGVTDGTQTRATAETSEYVYMKETIKPKMAKFVHTMNEYLLPMFGLDIGQYMLHFADPVPQNRELALSTYQNALANGWMSINEVRAKEGLPPVDNGDDVMIGFNLTPLGSPKEVPKAMTSTSPVSKHVLSLAQEITLAISPAIKQVVDMDEFERRGDPIHKAQVNRANPNVKKLTGLMVEFFDDEKKRALESFDSQYKKNAIKAKKSDLLNEDDEADALINQVQKFFNILVQAEGDEALRDAGLEAAFNARSERVQKALARQLQTFAGGVSEVTSSQIREAIADGLSAGEAIPAIRKRVEDVSAFGKSRALVIAKTETTRAQNFASVEAWRESGVVEGKIWFTAQDERVDDECAALHGEEFGLDENIDPGNSYGRVDGPPIHVNCRCTLIPVVSKKSVTVAERQLVTGA